MNGFIVFFLLSVLLTVQQVHGLSTYEHSVKNGKAEIFWTLSENDIAMAISAPVQGYVSVGFSPNGKMIGGHAVVGSVSDGTSSIAEYSLASKERSGIVEFTPRNLTHGVVEEQNGITTLHFQRPLKQNGRTIDPEQDVNLIWAVHKTRDTFNIHSSDGSLNVNLKTGSSSSNSAYAKLVAHGILMWLAFGFCMPIAIMFAHWKPLAEKWFTIHRYLMIFSFVCALVSIGVIFSLKVENNSSHSGFHEIFGFILLGNVLRQILSGVFRVEKTSNKRRSWFLQHVWTGRVTLVMGTFQVAAGAIYYESKSGNESLRPLLITHCIFTTLLIAIVVIMSQMVEPAKSSSQ